MKDLIIDCFAGGGGASVGIEMAQKLVEANCPYLKVGERVLNFRTEEEETGQIRFA